MNLIIFNSGFMMFTDLPILNFVNKILKLNAESYTTFHSLRSIA